ncbi:MAG: hypothetical protein AAF471_06545 [Myxococcota bacterium]
MRVEKKNKEHVKEAGLGLLAVYYCESTLANLALYGALKKTEATGLIIDEHNARVRKLMRELEEIVNQYKRQPPTQTSGGQP